ncbi:hypothetical protein [Lutibaculum baratangense]|uniref:Uncharacterized protein n=1 Tax=Lutibaculum baratangense AMV1 TaxID=631454 RepID=V4RPF4_9HYPH|nr:hypothetical protein [Lutibaculum baratangense]ESR27159.1 hypothetical protein N177_0138 [Lutibaculum baratangense AMV1]
MRTLRILALSFAASAAGAGAALANGEGILYPYRGDFPRSHPDRASYATQAPYKVYPQSTYRWDPQRQTWYYTGANWRYWNPMKRVPNAIITPTGHPPVPYGVYVRPD